MTESCRSATKYCDAYTIFLLRLFANVCQNTAIDIQNVSVYGVGGIGGKEYCGACKLIGFEPAACGRLCADERIEGMARAIGLAFAQGRRLGSGDVAGTYGVALNVVAAVFRADVAGEHFKSALGCGICRNGLPAQFAHHGADVYYLAVTLFYH